MKRQRSITLSLVLILIGVAMLMLNLGGFFFGFRIWQLWPLLVLLAGLLFVLPPLLLSRKRGLGGLFIPGLPMLTTGAILLFASVFNRWHAWEWLWPLEVISLALGFLFAALYMRVIWLLIPAIIIGANGLLFQFCALTGLWRAWSVLWTVEPLSVGLALLAVNLKRPSAKLLTAGIILCVIAAFGFVGSVAIFSFSTFLPLWWLMKWGLAITLIVLGIGSLIWALSRRAPVQELTRDLPAHSAPD